MQFLLVQIILYLHLPNTKISPIKLVNFHPFILKCHRYSHWSLQTALISIVETQEVQIDFLQWMDGQKRGKHPHTLLLWFKDEIILKLVTKAIYRKKWQLFLIWKYAWNCQNDSLGTLPHPTRGKLLPWPSNHIVGSATHLLGMLWIKLHIQQMWRVRVFLCHVAPLRIVCAVLK